MESRFAVCWAEVQAAWRPCLHEVSKLELSRGAEPQLTPWLECQN